MPLRISDILDERREVVLERNGETLTLVISALGFTEELAERAAGADEAQAASMLPSVLSALVVDWDLLDADGEPIPATREGMRTVPTLVLMWIFNGLAEELRPKDATTSNGASSNGSRPKASSVPARRGTASSRARRP